MKNIDKHFPKLVLPWFDYEFRPKTVAQLTRWAQMQADLYLQPAFAGVRQLGQPFNALGNYWTSVSGLLDAANALASLQRTVTRRLQSLWWPEYFHRPLNSFLIWDYRPLTLASEYCSVT